MLFIIIHQVSRAVDEAVSARAARDGRCVRRDDLGPRSRCSTRVSRIQAQLSQAWEVLATMTPSDYSAFRNRLGPSSGFQSWQYRHAGVHDRQQERRDDQACSAPIRQRYEQLDRALRAPACTTRRCGCWPARLRDAAPTAIDRDFTQPYQANKQVAAAWLSVYHNSEKDWDLYELAERLVDLDYKFQLWRFAHMKTVERIIGYKRGTGGTGGVSYLNKALELRFFPELWSVRTSI